MRISLAAVIVLFVSTFARAADHPQLPAVTAADDSRVVVMTAADRAKLTELLSDDLHYAHSNGNVDSKKSLVEALASGKSKYLGIEYKERQFTFPAPGVALMTGKAWVKVSGASGEQEFNLSFLAVWREEQGKWRFLAWQSCRLPAATPAAPAPALTPAKP